MRTADTFIDSLYGRPNTIKTYRSLFNRWIRPLVKDPKIWDEYDLKAAVDYWDRSMLSARTRKTLIQLTAKYIKYMGGPILETTPITRLTMQRFQEKPIQVLDKTQLDTLLNICYDEYPRLFIPVMLGSQAGLRVGEVFGLEWSDVDLIKEELTVKRSYDGPTKSGRQRTVPLSHELGVFLLAESTPKIHNPDRERIVPTVFDPNPSLRGACKEAGIPQITFHGLRHTFATLALQSGKNNLKQVAEVLGHRSPKTTADIYWHVIGEKLNMEFLR